MGYDVSTGAAYAVLYTVLSVFTILAIISAGYCGKNPLSLDLTYSIAFISKYELTHILYISVVMQVRVR